METESQGSPPKQKNPKHPQKLQNQVKKPRNFWNFWFQPNEKTKY